MSESAKEVFERIPEARRDAAVREADERCHGLYARAWQENCGDVFEKGRAAVAAEDAARAAVFARFAEPAAPMQPVTGDCYHSSQNWRRESDGIHCDECEAEPAAPLASSHNIFMRIPEQCRAAARKEANTMGNDAWQARYDNTRGDLAAAAQAEEAARAKVFSRYAAPVEAGPTISDVKAALNRIPKERRIDAMHLADTETADVYRDAFRAADGDMAAKIRAGSAAERAARVAVYRKVAANIAVTSASDDRFAIIQESHCCATLIDDETPGAHSDCGWLIGEVKRLRAEVAVYCADIEAASGELLVDIPCPGTDAARMMLANRTMRRAVDELRAELATANEARSAGWAIAKARAELLKEHAAAAPLPDASRAMLTAALADAEEELRLVHGTERTLSAYASAFGTVGQAVRMVLEASDRTAPSPAWERLRVAAEGALRSLDDSRVVLPHEARELRAALDAIDCKPVPEQQNISVSKLRGSFSRARLDEVSLAAAEAKAAERDAACPVHPLHGAKPSDAWPRVVFVGPFGYDRDDHLNPTFSGQISGAKRFSDTEAQKRASQLRVAGYQKVRVIRLRPRAK